MPGGAGVSTVAALQGQRMQSVRKVPLKLEGSDSEKCGSELGRSQGSTGRQPPRLPCHSPAEQDNVHNERGQGGQDLRDALAGSSSSGQGSERSAQQEAAALALAFRDAASLLCLGPAGEDEQEEDEGAKEEEEEDDVGDQDGVKISSKDDEEGWEVSRLRWEKAIGTGLWASKMTARGWDALRNFVHQQAAFLPIARAELSGEYGDLGGADLATDPGSLATALALQQRRDRELAEPLVTALAELLREAAGAVDAMGRDQMEEAMRQCAEELPLALDDLTSGNLPSGARPPQWWENPDWAQRSVDTVMQELLQQALPYGDVLRRHWPQLLLDEGEGGHAGAAAWRRMVEAAEAAGTPQPRKEGARKMLLHAMMGLKRARGAGTPLYGALEPCWHPGRLDPCHVAAFEATFLGIQEGCRRSARRSGPRELPPGPLLYWVLSKVPPEALLLLHAWRHADTDRALPAHLFPEHLELAARVAMEQPLGVLCAVAFAGWWGSQEQQGAGATGPGPRLAEVDRAWLRELAWKAALGAELLRSKWRGASVRGPDRLQQQSETEPATCAKRQQQGQQPEQCAGTGAGAPSKDDVEPKARAPPGEGASGSAPARSLAPGGGPWVGPGALPRLQLALEALAEYGWLEEPYGCTNTDREDDVWVRGRCEHVSKEGLATLAEPGRGEEAAAREELTRLGAEDFVTAMREQMHDFAIFIPTGDAATAAFCDARAAALCVRGAPLSGCQLRGVVEALRPGLLAAHPGTWGAAVRRAEEREQRGEPEDDRLMLLLRSAVAGLAAAEPSSGLAGWLPTEGLGLAPCALAGILLAAAEQASCCLLPQRVHERIRHCALAVLLLTCLAHAPYELCHTVVQLMAAQPPHPGTAHLPPASASGRVRDAANTYGTYLQLALYDTACTALVVQIAFGVCRKRKELLTKLRRTLPSINMAAEHLGFLAATHATLREACTSTTSTTSTGTQPGAAGQQQQPPATWHDLQQTQAAAVQQAAVAHMLGTPTYKVMAEVGSRPQTGAVYTVLGTRPASGRAGGSQDVGAIRVLDIHGALDSHGLATMQWGEQLGNEVAGVLLSARLYGYGQEEVRVAVRGGEAMALLLVALHSGGKPIRPLVLRPQLPPHLAGRQGDPMLHIVPGPVSAAARHSRRSGQAGAEDDSEGEGSRLEAAAAASTLCLGLCAGATLTRGDDVEQLYPPMAEMVRGAVVVTATSSWGAAYSVLRGAFFGKRACNLTRVTGQGVLGAVRALMLVAKLREEMAVAGREVNVVVTGVHLTECKQQLEEMTKKAQQQQARAGAGAGTGAGAGAGTGARARAGAVAGVGRAAARGAAANADAGAAAHQSHESRLAAMERVLDQLPIHMMKLIARGRLVLDLEEVKRQKVARLVKAQGEEDRKAVEQLVDTLGVLVRQLYDADGLVRSGVLIEMQVVEVEAGGWDKLVPPLGGKGGPEGKGAGAGGKAGGKQDGAAAGRKQKGKQKR